MKKITVVCLATERKDAIQTMQKLGTLHVTPFQTPSSRELDALTHRQEALNRAIAALDARKTQTNDGVCPSGTPQELLDKVLALLDEQKEKQATIDLCRTDIALLEPWGTFDQTQLDSLAQHGIHVGLFVARAQQLKTLELPEDTCMQTIAILKGQHYIAVISKNPLPELPLSPAPMPSQGTDIHQLENDLARYTMRVNAIDSQLDALAPALPALKSLMPGLEDKLAFTKALDSMGETAELAYIGGYIPEIKLDAFLSCARRSGWAVHYEDIAEDDRDVPTLLRIPKRFSMAKVIFDFVGILPGYFETDISISMLVFLSLFCGMLIGDAGYGAILSAVAWYFLRKAKTPGAQNGLKLLLTMMLCTFGFGALSGNWFGIPPTSLPVPFCGIPWLAQDESQGHVKLLCFFIGAFHTSLARAWAAWNARKSIRDLIGNLGWGAFLWGNFFAASALLVGPIPHTDALMKTLYAIGLVGILVGGINWKEMGDVIYSPFAFINSFVDILSYIRLYAVGLSGVYIAMSFNNMATAIWDSNPWLIPVGLLVLVIGHVLNVTMAALSILVHGIRLNTLEFSGHIGLSWSGKPYTPLKNQPEK